MRAAENILRLRRGTHCLNVRPYVSGVTIDAETRRNLTKLERVLVNDLQLDNTEVIQAMNYVFKNFVEGKLRGAA